MKNRIFSPDGLTISAKNYFFCTNQDTPDVFLVRGAGGTLGTLKLTGQSNKFFIAAEKLSGVVAEGDTVYRRRLNTELEAEDAPVVPSGGATEVGPQDNVGAMEPVRPEKQDRLALP